VGKLPELLLVWAPLVVVLGVWVFLRPKYGRQLAESAERSRELIELQRHILSCLEDIRTELKAANTMKGS
jgi:hypothetical protein